MKYSWKIWKNKPLELTRHNGTYWPVYSYRQTLWSVKVFEYSKQTVIIIRQENTPIRTNISLQAAWNVSHFLNNLQSLSPYTAQKTKTMYIVIMLNPYATTLDDDLFNRFIPRKYAIQYDLDNDFKDAQKSHCCLKSMGMSRIIKILSYCQTW